MSVNRYENFENILDRLTEYINVFDLDANSRKRYYVYNRFYLSFFMHLKLKMRLDDIANILCLKDHSTILNCIKRHQSLIIENEEYKKVTKQTRSEFNFTGNYGAFDRYSKRVDRSLTTKFIVHLTKEEVRRVRYIKTLKRLNNEEEVFKEILKNSYNDCVK